MNTLKMFWPHEQDNLADLAYKVSMVNAFGRTGLGTEAERDAVIAALRQAMRKVETFA
jgi:hypothetical protein